MKSKVLVVLFSCIAFLFVFLLGFNFFFLRKRSRTVSPKVIMPVASGGSSSGEENGESVSDDTVLTSFVPLLPTETLMSTLTVDFDGDTFDDQVVAVRRAGSPYLFLIVGLYNPDTNSYSRSAEISTEISKLRTFSYDAVDMIGNHKMVLVYQGILSSGDSVMQLFLCRKKFGAVEIKKIGDFSSDGTIFIQQTERSDAYELSQAWGAPYTVWVYSSDKTEAHAPASGGVSQIQTEYKWDYDTEMYVQARQLQITGSRMAAKELARIQNGGVETFGQFLSGLWYKTNNASAVPSYIYFNYDEREVIFLSDDTEGVYSWEDSSLRRSGIYLTTVNSIISSMKRSFDIMLTGMNEISVHVHDNVGMIIKESNQWDGTYKKMSFQNTFGEAKAEPLHAEYMKKLTEEQTWTDDDGNVFVFDANSYKISGSENESGIYVADTVGSFPVIQFRSSGANAVLASAYAMHFETSQITVPAKNRRQKPTVQTVVDKDCIHLTPVTLSPLTCYAADGRVITLRRRDTADGLTEGN